ncbi:4-phosphopantetheinyl transferase family protein [Flavobacterium franklandianum]|uniref:4-phosphopantetheinyl transferase family protein n=1 Tax=Flavobacterium franklandianum TaxID=2594430 RepID=A0A553C890_9FLAO|nr:4'-phosphopantetheinyl transferase superfamily protein [Flavobacterium franklandianum]TRX16728.1 4-phosphopantetheinyl transferase family protein [Flavobacterium franklandianum]TRX29636.1 4-phosphopantetheinyl transferase family protein [Flavobacterium franklandianum]
MIGNDIVDLALAEKESNWKRKGFMNKIFTQNEQLLISIAENPTIMVWNLWSRKEAAYKIHNRKTQIRGYFPLQLECFDLDCINEITFGKVVIKDFVYYTKTEIKSEFIHTIAVENTQHFDSISILDNRKNIRKKNGIPEYFENNILSKKPVSISHHGRFEQIITL